MTILGIETSCDETSVAVIDVDTNKHITLKSNVVATSLALHAKTGGIIPEVAAREQLTYMLPTLTEALKEGCNFNLTIGDRRPETVPPIDAIAVTYGPGLIGSLLVGIETAKTLSMVWKKPIIPVNHMLGHIYANFICEAPSSTSQASSQEQEASCQQPVLPALCLVVSGGHTDLVLIGENHSIQLLGGTRDDAAGEAFDKTARLLGIPYPGGPAIEILAKTGDPKRFHFPRPLIGEDTYEFSFSGLKTAVLREVRGVGELTETDKADFARGLQDAIIDVLLKKTLKAAAAYKVKSVLLSGGVAANQTLVDAFKVQCSKLQVHFSVPQKNLCTDNAAMIAAAAVYQGKQVPWQDVAANPELYY